MKFRKRIETIDAIQWTGENRKELFEFCANHQSKCSFGPLSGELLVTDWLGTFSPNPGYWIVHWGQKGRMECLPDEEFRRLFEPARDVIFVDEELTPAIIEALRSAADTEIISCPPHVRMPVWSSTEPLIAPRQWASAQEIQERYLPDRLPTKEEHEAAEAFLKTKGHFKEKPMYATTVTFPIEKMEEAKAFVAEVSDSVLPCSGRIIVTCQGDRDSEHQIKTIAAHHGGILGTEDQPE